MCVNVHLKAYVSLALQPPNSKHSLHCTVFVEFGALFVATVFAFILGVALSIGVDITCDAVGKFYSSGYGTIVTVAEILSLVVDGSKELNCHVCSLICFTAARTSLFPSLRWTSILS